LSFFAGRLDEAEVAAQKALELSPQGGLTYFWLGLVRLGQGRLDEAQEMFQRESHDTFRLLGLSQAHYAAGRSAESGTALQELIEKDAAGAAYQIALGYAYRGETDLAFEWLERAYVQRDPGLGMMKISTPLWKMHDDPRWQPFIEKMGLAD
jgi:tetratricopeptide (TPR) repeat protein